MTKQTWTVQIGLAAILLLLTIALFIQGQTTIGLCTLAVGCANATLALRRREGARP
jgi:hypothetical protein